jgi:hypothetical protein
MSQQFQESRFGLARLGIPHNRLGNYIPGIDLNPLALTPEMVFFRNE